MLCYALVYLCISEKGFNKQQFGSGQNHIQVKKKNKTKNYVQKININNLACIYKVLFFRTYTRSLKLGGITDNS